MIEIAGKSTVRTVYALPKFTIPDDQLLVVELYEKNGGRHQTIRVENADKMCIRDRCQTTITILSTVKISISNETDFWIVRPLAGRVCGKRTNR